MKKLLFVALLIAFNTNINVSTIFASDFGNTSEIKTKSEGFEIAKAGIAKAVIVIPASADADVKLASEELCNHIEKATKVRLSIITDDSPIPASMNRIYLGACHRTLQAGLMPDELISNYFYVKVAVNELFLAGKDKMEKEKESRGTLFAVYHWLDTQLGVKWLWPGEVGTVIPKTEIVTSGAEGQQLIMAPFIHSRMWVGYQRDKSPYSDSATVVCTTQSKTWLTRHRMVESVSFNYPENFLTYWDRFGKTNPEFFALRPDGTRRPFDERSELVQMCVSQSKLHKQVVEDWLVHRKKVPYMPFVNCNENDRRINEDPSCICDACKAWDPKPNPFPLANPPFVSDRYAKSWLAVQTEARKIDPDAVVFAYAYMGYVDAPVETKLNENIIVSIVPQYEYPLAKTDTTFKRIWGGWYKTGARLSLRPNYFLDGYCLPFIFAREFGNEFKYAFEHGMIGTDFCALTGMWGTQGPNLYMAGRLQDKPDMSVDAVLDEYYNGFGPAAKQIRAYFDYWEQISLRKDSTFKKKYGMGSSLSRAGESIYTEQTFVEGNKLLASARVAAAKSSEDLKRVEYLEVWLKHAELAMETLMAYRKYESNPELLPNLQKAKDTLDAYRMRYYDEYFSAVNWGSNYQDEVSSGWRKVVK